MGKIFGISADGGPPEEQRKGLGRRGSILRLDSRNYWRIALPPEETVIKK